MTYIALFCFVLISCGVVQHVTGEPGLYDLIPGRLNDTLSYSEVLQGLPKTNEGQAAINWLVNFFAKSTGISLPTAVIQKILVQADVLLDYLALTVKQMRAAIDAINIAFQNGLIPPPQPKMELTLQSPFPLEDLSSIDIDLSQYQPPLAPIGADLYHGYSNSSEPDDKLKNNIRFAALLQNFVRNYHPNQNPNSTSTHKKRVKKPKNDRFSQPIKILDTMDKKVSSSNDVEGFLVSYQGQVLSDPGDLILALNQNGHEVTGHFTCRAADFFGLWKKQGDKLYPIAAPFMIVTDVNEYNSTRKVTLPAFHCELAVSVKSKNDKKDRMSSNLNADVVWFEGTGGIGFIGDKLNTLTQWAGTVDRFPLTVDQVAEAVRLGTLFAEVLLETEKRFNLYLMGYGATGACTDSVGVLLQVLFQKPLVYPFLMRKDYLLTVLADKLKIEPNARKAYLYFQLLQAVKSLPVDYQENDSTPQRILGSFPWEKGQEPFYTASAARSTLERQMASSYKSKSRLSKRLNIN